MDKSEQYIKMCEKAEEIQERNWKKGDYYFRKGEGVVVLFDGDGYGENIITGWTEIHIWLPHQDQLQEIYGSFDECMEALYWWKETGSVGKSENYWGYDYDSFASMEQLWLAFVMKEKYNKVWAGDSWGATTN